MFWKITAFGRKEAESGKSGKRHIYTPRRFIWTDSQVSTTIRYKETAWKSSCFEKPLFLDILQISAISGARFWPKLSKGTSTGQELLYEPIPRSLRPSVTKKQPGKESMTDRRTDRRTDGHPESIGPQPLGLGPKNYMYQSKVNKSGFSLTKKTSLPPSQFSRNLRCLNTNSFWIIDVIHYSLIIIFINIV